MFQDYPTLVTYLGSQILFYPFFVDFMMDLPLDLHQTFLNTVPITRLTKEQFVIPSYQRGYRWAKQDVTYLLNDVADFATSLGATFYCLQPIVVRWKKAANDMPDGWEVIDGQQRLTTIWHILDALKVAGDMGFKPLQYVTEARKEVKEGSLDDVYRKQAAETIQNWLKANPAKRDALKKNLLHETKVIWYQTTDNDEVAQTVFTRLNAGKIPLSNSELIKALLLKRPTLHNKQSDYTPRQLQLATDWDWIEAELARPEFWGWLKPTSTFPAGRIEQLFRWCFREELKGQPSTTYSLFDVIRKRLDGADEAGSTTAADALWHSVKNLFLQLHGWFEDTDLYHRIGFLRTSGVHVSSILDLAVNKPKSTFRSALKQAVWNAVSVTDDDPDTEWDDYRYGDGRVHSVLTLHNVATAWASASNGGRYPFHLHHQQAWSIEHIHPQSDASPDLEDQPLMHGLGNLALLPQSLNSSLQDKSFDQKRAEIIQWSSSANTFVPPATRDAFLKAFSFDVSELPEEKRKVLAVTNQYEPSDSREWSPADRLVYREVMRQSIKNFLNS